MDDLKKLIREVPDFPKPGINFYDITTLLKHPDGLRKTVDALAAEYEGEKVDTVIGVEASFLPLPLPITWAQVSYRCVNQRNSRRTVSQSRMTSSMVRTRSKSIVMQSATDTG